MTDRKPFENCAACEMPRSCQGVRYCAKREHPHRPRNPDSIMCRVQAAVEQHGPCTVDVLLPHLPDLTRAQVNAGLSELRRYGRLDIAEYGKPQGRGAGRSSAVYAVASAKPPKPAAPRMITSVFDLGRA